MIAPREYAVDWSRDSGQPGKPGNHGKKRSAGSRCRTPLDERWWIAYRRRRTHLIPSFSARTIMGERSLDSIKAAGPLQVIEPRAGWSCLPFGEIWRFRELLFYFAWRDVKVRYKQALLGILWAVLQPVAFMAAFALFFDRMADHGDASLPYPLFVLAGLLPWNFVSATVGAATQSIVGNQNLVSKVYFPRLLMPVSSVGAPLLDLLIGVGLLLLLLLHAGCTWRFSLLLLPLVTLGLGAAAVGIGSFFAALTVSFRDFRYIVPRVVQLGMLLTPAVYLQAEQDLPEWLQVVLPWNPMNGLISAFRSCLVGAELNWPGTFGALAMSLTLLLGGAYFFQRAERAFADII
ncbi:MAG: ABC transporter permease [Gemmataceae bacterium]